MKNHCIYGEEILNSQSLDIFIQNKHFDVDSMIYTDELLNTAAVIAKSHHERYNGSGYPDRLKKNEIPIEARIVSVADVYDAIGTERAYKKAWDEQKCQDYIKNNAGELFDPVVVNAFISNINKITMIKRVFKEEQNTSNSYVLQKLEKEMALIN